MSHYLYLTMLIFFIYIFTKLNLINSTVSVSSRSYKKVDDEIPKILRNCQASIRHDYYIVLTNLSN